jgi:cobalt/nickel transport system permease protein
MHISDGILSPAVLLTGASLTVAGTVYGLKKIKYEEIPRASILASAFYVASLIHIPMGVSSIHLILNGLLGIMLGWAAVPVIVVALFLQLVMFQHGGLTSLGVNAFNMAFPAVCVYTLFHPFLKRNFTYSAIFSFLAGFTAVLLSSLLCSLSLFLSGKEFSLAAKAFVLFNIPLMLLEGLITSFILAAIIKINPELIGIKVTNNEN